MLFYFNTIKAQKMSLIVRCLQIVDQTIRFEWNCRLKHCKPVSRWVWMQISGSWIFSSKIIFKENISNVLKRQLNVKHNYLAILIDIQMSKANWSQVKLKTKQNHGILKCLPHTKTAVALRTKPNPTHRKGMFLQLGSFRCIWNNGLPKWPFYRFSCRLHPGSEKGHTNL